MIKELNIVYLIDDDEIMTFLTNNLLLTEHFCKKVMMFTDAEMALSQLKEALQTKTDIPDIILLDLQMPVMTGWDFIEEFKKLDTKIPAFVFTSSINPADKNKAHGYPEIKDFILKPLTKMKLQKILRLANH
jgi:CheY-like chemotaxis protein